jgi:CubicO group peptidase (beta-lactamase class C family)
MHGQADLESKITRRALLTAGAAVAFPCRSWTASSGSAKVDEALRSGIESRKIPAAVGMIADKKKTLYAGAFGTRDSSGAPAQIDSLFNIASMTKAVTTVAALQLVEQGKTTLGEPVAKRLPRLAALDVLEGFDEGGRPILRPAKEQVTLLHLLTHTSGLCYDIWDERMFRYVSGRPAGAQAAPGPLMFEPGTRWQYGQGVDWAGRLVESISGMTLEDYFQEKIFRPLGMNDTSYIMPEAKFERLVSNYHRDAGGDLKQDERKLPARPSSFNGGGGLYSTAADYVRFMQMILNQGAGSNGARLLKQQTVASMLKNQIGELGAGKMKSFRPAFSSDVDIQPGHEEKWGLGFLINTDPYTGGRAAGSGAWAGLFNTFYWIDPKRGRCGVLLMQFLPFVDKEAVGLLDDFEKAAYRNL